MKTERTYCELLCSDGCMLVTVSGKQLAKFRSDICTAIQTVAYKKGLSMRDQQLRILEMVPTWNGSNGVILHFAPSRPTWDMYRWTPED